MARPTTDPKTEIVSVRLAPRHVRYLARRARNERITVSEALRRMLDELASIKKKRQRPPRTAGRVL